LLQNISVFRKKFNFKIFIKDNKSFNSNNFNISNDNNKKIINDNENNSKINLISSSDKNENQRENLKISINNNNNNFNTNINTINYNNTNTNFYTMSNNNIFNTLNNNIPTGTFSLLSSSTMENNNNKYRFNYSNPNFKKNNIISKTSNFIKFQNLDDEYKKNMLSLRKENPNMLIENNYINDDDNEKENKITNAYPNNNTDLNLRLFTPKLEQEHLQGINTSNLRFKINCKSITNTINNFKTESCNNYINKNFIEKLKPNITNNKNKDDDEDKDNGNEIDKEKDKEKDKDKDIEIDTDNEKKKIKNRAKSGSIFNIIPRTNSIKSNNLIDNLDNLKYSLANKRPTSINSINKISNIDKSVKKIDIKVNKSTIDSLIQINSQENNERLEKFSFIKYLDPKLKYYILYLEKYSKIDNEQIFNKLDTIEYYKIVIAKKNAREYEVYDDCKKTALSLNKKRSEKKITNQEKCEIVDKINELKEEYNDRLEYYKKEKTKEEDVLKLFISGAGKLFGVEYEPKLGMRPKEKKSSNLVRNKKEEGSMKSIKSIINSTKKTNDIEEEKKTEKSKNKITELFKRKRLNTNKHIDGDKERESRQKEKEREKEKEKEKEEENQNEKEKEKGVLEKLTEKYDEIFKQLNYDYTKRINKLEKNREKLNSQIFNYEIDIKILKKNFRNLTIQQKDYYLELLEKGIDVRSEGLVWIVKKLLEMDISLDYFNFPKFLEKNHIEYILSLSKKYVEISQNKLLIESLRINNSNNISENKTKKKDEVITNSKKTIFQDSILTDDSAKTSEDLNKNKKNERKNSLIFLSPIKKSKFYRFSTVDENLKKDKDASNGGSINKFEQIVMEKSTVTFIKQIANCSYRHDPYSYVRTFSEKVLSIFEDIFKNYELMGLKFYNQIKKEEFVRNNLQLLYLHILLFIYFVKSYYILLFIR
jgi:hypothetical protein